jgi:GT2 family glycosyltransferase
VTPRISVVVPTCRRPELLEGCLGALANQDYDPRACEVVIADDAGDEATRCLVQQYSAVGLPARYVCVGPRHGPAAARTAGWRAARGMLVAFTDDDCLPSAEWLRAGCAAFTDDTAAVAGQLSMPLPQAQRRPTDYERKTALLATAGFVTANCFVRRAVLEELDGFDERYELAWREDSDLLARILARGGVVAQAPDAVVLHPVRPARWGVSLAQQRKSSYNALLYREHPEFYRREIQAGPPWRYYGAV